MQILQIDEHLMHVLVKATRDGLAMANLKPVPVGVGKYINTYGEVSAIVGCVGPTSGSLMLNASEQAACFMAGHMIGEEIERLTPQAMDGFSEIGNIIAGQTKAILSTTEHRFDRISVPSVVVGSSYFISHYKGMMSVSVEFEIPEMCTTTSRAGVFCVSMCLMKV